MSYTPRLKEKYSKEIAKDLQKQFGYKVHYNKTISTEEDLSSIEKNYDALNVIVSRALYPEYRHEIIIKAIKKTIDKKIPVNLKIIGVGTEETNLKLLTKKLGIET